MKYISRKPTKYLKETMKYFKETHHICQGLIIYVKEPNHICQGSS